MITITSMVQAIKGSEDELEKHLIDFSKKVKTEEGTIVYDFHRLKNEKGRFFFYEKFTDKNAFECHNSTTHMQELTTKFGNLLANEPELTYLEEITSLSSSI